MQKRFAERVLADRAVPSRPIVAQQPEADNGPQGCQCDTSKNPRVAAEHPRNYTLYRTNPLVQALFDDAGLTFRDGRVVRSE